MKAFAKQGKWKESVKSLVGEDRKGRRYEDMWESGSCWGRKIDHSHVVQGLLNPGILGIIWKDITSWSESR